MTMMRVGVLFLCLSLTPVQAISYTVQLFASSDQERALQLQSELGEQNYPAYLLSVPTAQGQVYRIRVGAFGNRAAAALFAEVLQGVEGSTPSPALAEGGVPPGLIPLQSALLGQYDVSTTLVQVFPWPIVTSAEPSSETEESAAGENTGEENTEENTGDTQASSPEDTDSEGIGTEEDPSETTPQEDVDTEDTPTEEPSSPAETDAGTEPSQEETQTTETDEPQENTTASQTDSVAQTGDDQEEPEAASMVIRVQPKDASEQALYRVGSLEFEAWRAAPLENGWILRVRSFLVWPEAWQTASDAEREQYRETVLANLSADLDLTPQQLEPFVFELEGKAPFVVLVERFNPETQQIERLRSIGQPRPNQENLGLTLEGPSSFLGEAVTIPAPEEDTIFEPNARTPIPESLTGKSWQAQSDGEFVVLSVGGESWRAAVGQPLWASGNLLISFYDNHILVYDIQEP